jgi:predicted phosphodiesterase
MEQTPWSPEEITLLEELRPYYEIKEVIRMFTAAGFTRTPKAIKRKIEKLGFKRIRPGFPQEPRLETDNQDHKDTWKKILDLRAGYFEDIVHHTVGMVRPEKIARKILSLADLHIPFERDDLIHQVISSHRDADVLVINGDFLELYAVSTWPKERGVVLQHEYNIAMEYMKLFSKTFPYVVLVRGNHEVRLQSYFNQNVSQSVSFLVNKDILARLAAGEVYDNAGNIIEKHDFSNVYCDSGPESWFVKIGKTIFVHPKTMSSKIEGRTAVSAEEYFLEREDIDSVIVAHTHKQAWIPSRGKICIEQGCLCCPLDYEKRGKLNFKPTTLGYCVVYQDAEGNCDFNATRPIYLGTQSPVKQDTDLLDDFIKKGRTHE